MSERNLPIKSVPVNTMLEAAGRGKIDSLDVPDLRQTPFDTSFANTSGAAVMPPEVSDVREALKPGFGGWPHGTVVRATVSLGLNNSRNQVIASALTVDNAFSRYIPALAGEFLLGDLDQVRPEVAERISMMGLRRIVADFLIFNPDARRHFHDKSVPAKMEPVYAVERPFDGNYEGLRPREAVFVEGELESYDPGRSFFYASGMEGPNVKIRQPDGSVITVSLDHYNELHYDAASMTSGVRELAPPYPLPGDRLQVAAELSQNLYGSETLHIKTTNRAAAYLLNAPAERLEHTLTRHDSMETVLDFLRSAKKPEVIRSIVGNYLASVLYEDRGRVVCELSELQYRQLSEASARPGRAADMPVGLQLVSYKERCYRLVKTFGKDILSMTGEGFSTFMMECAAGEHPTNDVRVSEDIYDYGKSDPEQFVMKVFNNFYDRYKASRAERDEPLIEHQFEDQYAATMLDYALKELPNVQSERKIAGRLIEITLDAFKRNSELASLRATTAAALVESLMRCGVWDRQPITGIGLIDAGDDEPLAIKSEAAYQMYREALPQVLQAMTEANDQDPFMQVGNSGMYERHIRALEMLIVKLNRIARD